MSVLQQVITVMVAIVNNVETLLRMKRVGRTLLTTQSYEIQMLFNLRLKMVQFLPVFGRYIHCTDGMVCLYYYFCIITIVNFFDKSRYSSKYIYKLINSCFNLYGPRSHHACSIILLAFFSFVPLVHIETIHLKFVES